MTDLQLTSDGGYILGGESFSPPDGEKTAPRFGDADYWVVRLDAAGNKLWDRSYGGANWDAVFEMQQTSDGGFVLGGASASPPGGSKRGVNFGSTDFWLVRIDANGNQLWDRSYGGSAVERWGKAQQTRDGGFVLVGSSASGANGNKTTPAIGAEDGWLVRTDGAGNKLWDQTYGSSLNDFLQQGVETGDGGVMAAGWTEASGRAHGWALQSNVDGIKRWERVFGGSGDDLFRTVTMLADGRFGWNDRPGCMARAAGQRGKYPLGTHHWGAVGQHRQPASDFRQWAGLASEFGRVIKLGPEQERCDSDGDGVPDALDECPNTTGGPVNVRGCSLAQLCPCEGPWTNHGQYVNCVTRNAGDFYRAGLITADERRNMVRGAGSSPCD